MTKTKNDTTKKVHLIDHADQTPSFPQVILNFPLVRCHVRRTREVDFPLCTPCHSTPTASNSLVWTKDYGPGKHYVDASEVPATFFRPSLANLVNLLTCLCLAYGTLRRDLSGEKLLPAIVSRAERHRVQVCEASRASQRLGEKMDARLLNIEQKMEDWDRRMTGIETSIASCTDALATNTRSISHNTLKIRNLEERAEALERRARENNLIIYGIESAETDSRELLLQKVKKLMAEDMQITDDVVIAESHRLGRGPKSPILIEVPDHEFRISILKNSSKLRILNIFMSRDYSPQIREQRKNLIEKRKELYKKGIGSKLRDNKLLLNGINYMVVEGQVGVATMEAPVRLPPRRASLAPPAMRSLRKYSLPVPGESYRRKLSQTIVPQRTFGTLGPFSGDYGKYAETFVEF
ncbi:hypothetical protein LAZ67_7001518 [Cordylochernes scorpioides]|uniref:Uncharacterized protein n=1 Tax=Cordylochernes scorpioides TaxID=51811 RepID=A0ABY6KNX7_9ARAC|nr:hypothetical protein LAZ67_7001518 [Cordylochernes scorpioides]